MNKDKGNRENRAYQNPGENKSSTSKPKPTFSRVDRKPPPSPQKSS